MCVIKPAASGIFRCDSLITKRIMEEYGSNVDPEKMKDIKVMLRPVGVQSDYLAVKDSVNGMCFLQFMDGLFLATVVDQNGTTGHCVFIDTERKFIIDPANKKEIWLTLRNLFECAGPWSLTLEFCRVLRIHLPQRTRKDDKTRSKRQEKRRKKG